MCEVCNRGVWQVCSMWMECDTNGVGVCHVWVVAGE